VKAATQAIRERRPDASSLHERSSLVSNGVVRNARAAYRKGANEKPTGFINTTLAGGIVFLIPAVREAAPDIALGQKVGTAQGV
jgi:hypothetical protein